MGEFYVLNTSRACDRKLYAGGQWVNDTCERCPTCNVFDDRTEPEVIEIALNHLGRQGFTEYLWNSHSLPIFRQDVTDLWRAQRLTGFTTKPVRIVGWRHSPSKALPPDIPKYQRLRLTSVVELSEPPPVGDPCPDCGVVLYDFPKLTAHLPKGISVDRSTWDGSEFCGLPGYAFVFCTRRAASVTLQAGFNRRIAFIREQDLSRWEEFDIRKWTPKAYSEYIESFLIRRVEDL